MKRLIRIIFDKLCKLYVLTSFQFPQINFILFFFYTSSNRISARTELSYFPGNVVQLLISLPELCSLVFWPISMHASTGIKSLTVLWVMVNICNQCCAILLEAESISRYFSCWKQKISVRYFIKHQNPEKTTHRCL